MSTVQEQHSDEELSEPAVKRILLTGKSKSALDLTKDDLGNMIMNKCGEIFLKPKPKDDLFVVVEYEANRVEENSAPTKFLCCSKCKILLANTEGGHLNRHRNTHARKVDSVNVDQKLLTSFFQSSKPSQAEINKMKEAIVDLCLLHSVSFSIVEKEGLKRVVKMAMDIGAKRHGLVDIDALLVNRTTISRCVAAKSSRLIKQIAPKLVALLKKCGGAFGLDYGKRLKDYLCVRIHFLDVNWKFQSICVAMFRCGREAKDYQQVWTHLVESVRRFSISEDLLSDLFCISDQGANVTKALSVFNGKNVHCICHLLNTIAKRTFSPYKFNRVTLREADLSNEEKEHINKARQILSYCKEVVTGLRNTPLEDQLGFKLVRDGDTRWLSKLHLISSTKKALDKLIQLKKDKSLATYFPESVSAALDVLNFSRRQLDDCIRVMKIFEEPMLYFQSKSIATIHTVWPLFESLRKKFQRLHSNYSSSEFLRALSKSAGLCFNRKSSSITIYHKMSTFLHPAKRKFSGLDLNQTEVNEVLDSVRANISTTSTFQGTCEVSSVHSRQPLSSIEELFQPEEEAITPADEVDRYLVKKFLEVPQDLAQLWKDNAAEFPGLARLASKLLSIPASTAEDEMWFSKLRQLVEESRESLSAESIFSVCVGKSLMESDIAFE